ncbi:MAG: hypothetical protein O3A47_00595 [Chloroflexi bacterium]|nr:hypothetical protein [Chloroflexota bacterium]
MAQVLRFHVVAVSLALLAVVGTACSKDDSPTTTRVRATPRPAATTPSTRVLAPVSAPTQQAPAPAATAAPRPTSTATPTATLTPTPRRGQRFVLEPRPTPSMAPPIPAQVLAAVAPSLALVETPRGLTTGVLIDGGYLVAQARTVWPFDRVRIAFPGDDDSLDAPVLGWDLLSDIAVIGPVAVDAPAASTAPAETFSAGTALFRIGYPEASRRSPSISTTPVYRTYKWAGPGLTYLLTGPGTGGVLVSSEGEVVGLALGDGYAASVADVEAIARSLIEGGQPAGSGGLALGAVELEHSVDLESRSRSSAFILTKPLATSSIRVTSEVDVALDVVDVTGELVLTVDNVFSGVEAASIESVSAAPYFVIVSLIDGDSGSARLTADSALAPLRDTDDGGSISIGDTLVGAIHHPLDSDSFGIELSEGDVVEVVVESTTIDPVLSIDVSGATTVRAAPSTDAGPVIHRAAIVYRPPKTGTYSISVSDATGRAVGGYVLTASPTTSVPAESPALLRIPTASPGPFGRMATHEVPGLVALQHLASWVLAEQDRSAGTATYSGPRGDALRLSAATAPGATLEEYADRVLSSLQSDRDGFVLVTRRTTVTSQGQAAELVQATVEGGEQTLSLLIYLREGEGFTAAYSSASSRHEKLGQLVEYSFRTFEDTLLTRLLLLKAVRPDRHSHSATLLADGRLLVVGGIVEDLTVLESTAFLDTATWGWAKAPQLAQERRNHTATLLADGSVMVIGGHGAGPEIHSLAERLDPATGEWFEAGEMAVARLRHASTLLPDEKVLVTGGGTEIAELYDPEARIWSSTGSMSRPRDFHAAVMLGDGRILAVGGVDDTILLASAELYDPETGDWSPTGDLLEPRRGHTATLLSDGRVLVVSGKGETEVLTSAEVFDPATREFSPAGTMSEGRIWHTATLLSDGRVLVAGGEGASGGTAEAEIYDPVADAWTVTGSMSRARLKHTATLLPDGRVIVIGAGPFSGDIDIYEPASDEWSPW